MPGKTGFDFNVASQSFNVLAEYLFGKNTTKEKMQMTTPVLTSKTQSDGEKMEMTIPVITKRQGDRDEWQMSFIMPSKYGPACLCLKIHLSQSKRCRRKLLLWLPSQVLLLMKKLKQRELKLRDAMKDDRQFQVKEGASVEVAQNNPPFTLPFTRRNEIALEVERKEE